MILDNQQQKDILLQMINGSTFTGNILEKALELKQAIINAEIEEEEK